MRHRIDSQRGTVLMVAMILVLLMTGLAVAYVAVTGSQAVNTYTSYKSDRSLYMAEAGLAQAVEQVASGGDGFLQGQFAGGTFFTWVDALSSTEEGINCQASCVETSRAVQAVTNSGVHPIFNHAIFAGDSSDDPSYEMLFGGEGDQGDVISGDVYSGEDLTREGDASVDGTLRAEGDITGGIGEQVTLPIPDLSAMDYPNNNDINVTEAFDEEGYWTQFDYTRSYYGGSYGGYLVPESNPAHIFMKNPNHRDPENNSTVGDDYYLEDYYAGYPGTYNTPVTVSPDGNDKVYFIQGNFWINGHPTFDYVITTPDVHMTIVVEGDVYVSDNFCFSDAEGSGLAIIAIKAPGDPDGLNSGNVHIGDPIFGTIEEINVFLYAENTFFDNNLDEDGSYEFTINGIMSAGDHLSINRDYEGGGYYEYQRIGGRWRLVWVPGGTVHSRMNVRLDTRIFTGDLQLPGLPQQNPGGDTMVIIAWREITPQ